MEAKCCPTPTLHETESTLQTSLNGFARSFPSGAGSIVVLDLILGSAAPIREAGGNESHRAACCKNPSEHKLVDSSRRIPDRTNQPIFVLQESVLMSNPDGIDLCIQ